MGNFTRSPVSKPNLIHPTINGFIQEYLATTLKVIINPSKMHILRLLVLDSWERHCTLNYYQ